MTTRTILSKLVACKEEVGGYTVYVFQDLDSDNYVMCTRLPNWQCAHIDIGDVGYMNYKEIIAGVDEWYNVQSDKHFKYNFTGLYFVNFVPRVEKIYEEIQII